MTTRLSVDIRNMILECSVCVINFFWGIFLANKSQWKKIRYLCIYYSLICKYNIDNIKLIFVLYFVLFFVTLKKHKLVVVF